METHAHHLHKAPGKNIWHYFFEFLMLFLAVFCGFLAENYREHVVEREREKQFIETYIEDLKTDTASIRRNLVARQIKMNQLDSLMLLLSTHQIKGHENELYYLGRMLIRTSWFKSSDRTITQLKNSGSLRMIRNEQAADSMMSYQKLVETLVGNQDDERDERQSVYPILSKMFNPFVFDNMLTIDGIGKPENNPPLRTYDENVQLDLAFYVHQIKGSTFIIQARLKWLNNKATNTILFLKKEYHLE